MYKDPFTLFPLFQEERCVHMYTIVEVEMYQELQEHMEDFDLLYVNMSAPDLFGVGLFASEYPGHKGLMGKL